MLLPQAAAPTAANDILSWSGGARAGSGGSCRETTPQVISILSVAMTMHISDINYSVIDYPALNFIAEFGLRPGFP